MAKNVIGSKIVMEGTEEYNASRLEKAQNAEKQQAESVERIRGELKEAEDALDSIRKMVLEAINEMESGENYSGVSENGSESTNNDQKISSFGKNNKQFSVDINGRKVDYQRAANGDYIVPIDNLLVYTDFNRNNPGISSIIEIKTDDYSEIDVVTSYICEAEKEQCSYEKNRRICEAIVGKGNIVRYTMGSFDSDGKYDRQLERGKR